MKRHATTLAALSAGTMIGLCANTAHAMMSEDEVNEERARRKIQRAIEAHDKEVQREADRKEAWDRMLIKCRMSTITLLPMIPA